MLWHYYKACDIETFTSFCRKYQEKIIKQRIATLLRSKSEN